MSWRRARIPCTESGALCSFSCAGRSRDVAGALWGICACGCSRERVGGVWSSRVWVEADFYRVAAAMAAVCGHRRSYGESFPQEPGQFACMTAATTQRDEDGADGSRRHAIARLLIDACTELWAETQPGRCRMPASAIGVSPPELSALSGKDSSATGCIVQWT